jgi:hypothetical protein
MHKLIALNFHLSVWFSIIGGIVLINEPNWFFDDAGDLYGPLKNNLIIALANLSMMQLACWWIRYSGRLKTRAETLFMGFIFLGVAGGLRIYAEVNQLPVSDWLMDACFYISFSHLLYFWSDSLTRIDVRPDHT